MRLKPMIAALTLWLMIALPAYGQTSLTGRNNGYELYSWKLKGHWYYSLIPRTSGSKSYEEITASNLVRRDTSGLESQLRKLSRGEEVFWMGDAPAGAKKLDTGQPFDLKHPSRQRIKRIKAICDKLGIKLRLA